MSAQISQLFKDAPDLRSDFRIFMPEKNQHIFDDSDDNMPSASLHTRRADTLSSTAGFVNSSSVGSTLPQKRKRKVVEKDKDRDVGKVSSSNKVSTSSYLP